MTYLMFCYPGWSTCKKAREWLAENNISYEEKHIVKEAPAQEDLLKWSLMAEKPIQKFFNTSGVKYRRMELPVKQAEMSDQEKAALMSEDGMLIKRPLLIGEDFVLNGFKIPEWEEKLLP